MLLLWLYVFWACLCSIILRWEVPCGAIRLGSSYESKSKRFTNLFPSRWYDTKYPSLNRVGNFLRSLHNTMSHFVLFSIETSVSAHKTVRSHQYFQVQIIHIIKNWNQLSFQNISLLYQSPTFGGTFFFYSLQTGVSYVLAGELFEKYQILEKRYFLLQPREFCDVVLLKLWCIQRGITQIVIFYYKIKLWQMNITFVDFLKHMLRWLQTYFQGCKCIQ